MWTVIYGRHWVYLQYKEYRYETARWYLAFLVYLYYHFRYSMSVYPVKYVKIYRVDDGVPNLNTYSLSYLRRKGRKR